jgi:hypothetical protein
VARDYHGLVRFGIAWAGRDVHMGIERRLGPREAACEAQS